MEAGLLSSRLSVTRQDSSGKSIVPEETGPKGPTVSTLKRLFALSGNRCAFRNCTCPVIVEQTVVAEVCHIKAASPDGPRYDSGQTPTERHGFDNLILMCGPHHTIIDAHEEAFTVAFLTNLKVGHEENAVHMDDSFVERAANLLLVQTVSSAHQSGGITAHTVNADAIHFNSVSLVTSVGGAPDWTVQELFFHLRPNLDRVGPMEPWDEAGQDVLDKLSSGQLQAWGREIVRGTTTTSRNLAPVDAAYWRSARFTFVFLLDGRERDVHVNHDGPSSLPAYADLRVSSERALELWPHPQLGRWSVQSITLTANYFNHAPDQLTIACRTVTQFDAHIETISDGGAPYRRLVAPAYALAEGIDSSTIRSLQWKPQLLSFIDLATKSEKIFHVQGLGDGPTQSRRMKFLLEFQEGVSRQPIPPDSSARAAEFFGQRASVMHAGIEAPTVMRHGPRLIVRVVPFSALDGSREIDRAVPKRLGHFFSPEGFERSEDRPRQGGWIWRDPPIPVGLPAPVSWWYSRLDWNGYVEIVQTLLEDSDESRVVAMRGCPLERAIVKALDSVCDAYQELKLRSPAFLRVELYGVLGVRLAKSTAGRTAGFERPAVVTDVLSLVQMAKPLGLVLRSTLDSIWRAAGWADGSPSFARGDWDGYKNPFPYEQSIEVKF
jgi:hypothetical protein